MGMPPIEQTMESVIAVLTLSEQVILKLAARGYTYGEIARQADMSLQAVTAHKQEGMSKLSVANDRELSQLALAQGWLDKR